MISFDNAADLLVYNPATVLTASYTNNGNILFVSIVGGSQTSMNCTYNGVAMSLITTNSIPSDRPMWLFYLINPPMGTYNIIATGSSSDFMQGLAASYIDASGGIEVSGTNTTTSASSINKSLTSLIDQDWMLCFFASNNAGTNINTAQAGTTIRAYSQTYKSFALGDSNGAITPAGSYTMGVNYSVTSNGAVIGVLFKPSIVTTHTITKSLQYTIKRTSSLTKALQYTIKKTKILSLGLTYSINPYSDKYVSQNTVYTDKYNP